MFKYDKDLYYETRVKFTNGLPSLVCLLVQMTVSLWMGSDLNNADMLGFYLDGTTATNASMVSTS